MGNSKNKKKRIDYFIATILFIIGFLLCSFPLINGLIESKYQQNTIKSYKDTITASEVHDLRGCLENAREYNSIFYQTNGNIIGDNNEQLSDTNYNNLLNIGNNGVMGSIDIPKINANLPIYHGTSDEVLNIGIGHVQFSSLPVGGLNTHSVLTGHRGLPNSKLFTRLDELNEGDYFFIKVLNQTLAYQVKEIQVIKPEETDKLMIVPEKDLVSLVTCTPYGINTHRLVVTGERVQYSQTTYDNIDPNLGSIREILFTILPVLFLLIGMIYLLREKRRNRQNEKNNEID